MLPICSDREERGSLKRTKTINRESQKKINTYINRRRKCFKHSLRVDRRVSEAAGIFLMLDVQRYSGTLRQCATYLFQSLSTESHFHSTLRLDLALSQISWEKRKHRRENIPRTCTGETREWVCRLPVGPTCASWVFACE